MRKLNLQPIPVEVIGNKILVLREHRVMLDRDLAALYGVPVKRLNEQVKRNSERFPDDFLFQLTLEEGNAVLDSRSQIATLKRGRNIKYRPYAFTEHGAVMAANVLRSRVAVRASIQVVRAFVHLRQLLATNQDLARKIEAIERKVGKHDADLKAVLGALKNLLQVAPAPASRPIGFIGPTKKQQPVSERKRSGTAGIARLASGLRRQHG
ncbi:MAG TPA: ORF6N domain-containing protein [Bryobacteraceae bacterium]|nr:ORF6N domain-containing protein [Bryobacteraceae bacterium]